MTDWVETFDEPYHRRRFENEYVRSYDALIPMQSSTLYHRHTEDTLYVSIENARVKEQVFGEEARPPADVPAGIAICRAHRNEPLIHQVTNCGEGDMRMIGAEVKGTPVMVQKDTLDVPMHELLWQRERLRAYKFLLGPGESTGEIEYPFCGITISLTAACLAVHMAGSKKQILTRQPGDMIWHEGPVKLDLTNVGEASYQAFVGEWC